MFEDIVPKLIYADCAASRDQRGSGHEVRTVMVVGRALVREGVLLTAGEEAVRSEAQAEEMARRVADGVDGGDGRGLAMR